MVMVAPPGVQERRYALAQAMRALTVGGRLTVLAHKERGGARIAKELVGFGCTVQEESKRHQRICRSTRPIYVTGIEELILVGGIQVPPALGLWSQPGIFSWDRPDPGTLGLIGHLPQLSGDGADFGCGAGLLSRAILQSQAVTRLCLVDIDRRAIGAAKLNVVDPRAVFAWRDLRWDVPETRNLDFVVMNPPFHDGGSEVRSLGEAFVRSASTSLKPGGVCWLVANRHLPYEKPLASSFSAIRLIDQAAGYKIYKAIR
jgi:16S rRNA (guanine1207-N2)-methyltransferase